MVMDSSLNLFNLMFSNPPRTFALSVLATFLFTSAPRAQSNLHDTVFSQQRDQTSVMGRDFWFAPPQLFGTGSQYYQLCLTSPKNTTAHIQIGSFAATVSITAGKTATYSLPLTEVIKTSGIVESKGYHVWSDSADMDAMLVADFATDSAGDATQLLPDFRLGKDYAIASYEALFVGPGNTQYDYPSMFTIVAEHDNTLVRIIPTADMRQETETSPNPSTVAYPRGYPFTVTLQRGESVQYKTVLPVNLTDYDLTGTMIHSNYPIAVIGASQRTEIPVTFDHFNYIADMMPPVRSWDTLYYSLPFYQPPGVMDHDASSFTVIGTVPNQLIFRNDADGDHLFVTLNHAYDYYEQSDIAKASEWHSNAPFLLVQFINSSDYPSPENGALGSPAMLVVPPARAFGLSANIQLPLYSGAFTTQFSMFVDVVASASAKAVTLDGTSIRNWTKFTVDTSRVLYRSPNGGLATGEHLLQSDEPVGAYAYGYSLRSGESIGYSAVSGALAVSSADTTPPTLRWTLAASCGHAQLSDSGSGLSHIAIDSIQNFTLTPDPAFVPGDSILSTALDACPIDTSKNAYLRFTAYDMAGNRTTGELSFAAAIVTKLKPGFTIASVGFDTVLIGTSKTRGVITLTDTSSVWPVTFDSIWIDNPVFTDTAAADKFPFTLAPDSSRALQITFTPTQATNYSVQIHARSASAGTQTATLTGTGYVENGSVSSEAAPAMLLLPPAPNPAKRSLTLNYSLRAPARVTFEIFSILGDPVFQWNGGLASAGAHVQAVSLGQIPAGSYIYRFEAAMDNRSSTGEVQSGKLAIEP